MKLKKRQADSRKNIAIFAYLFLGLLLLLIIIKQLNLNLSSNKFGQFINNKIPTITMTQYKYLITPTPAPDFVGITQWYNSESLTLNSLKGKVVVVVFGRYYCQFCWNINTYLNEWKRDYGDSIEIIEFQSPKYEEEKDWNKIIEKLDESNTLIRVGFDLNKETSLLYNPEFVPTVYVIDKNGMIRYTHIGEGGFDDTAQAIDEVLTLPN